MSKRITQRDLIFPTDNHFPKTSRFFKYASRVVAASILNGDAHRFQFSDDNASVDADKEQLAHWILRRCSYSVSTYNLMMLTGWDEKLEKPNG